MLSWTKHWVMSHSFTFHFWKDVIVCKWPFSRYGRKVKNMFILIFITICLLHSYLVIITKLHMKYIFYLQNFLKYHSVSIKNNLSVKHKSTPTQAYDLWRHLQKFPISCCISKYKNLFRNFLHPWNSHMQQKI